MVRTIVKATIKFDNIESVVRIPVDKTHDKVPESEILRVAHNMLAVAAYNPRLEIEK